jgi:putative ABC transport system substrate-binding protein
MRRRDFIAIIGNAAAGWPLAGYAQQGPLPLVVFLQRTAPIRRDFENFHSGLVALGYERGRNVQIERRYAGSNDARLRELAHEAAQLNPAVIVVDGGVTATAVQAATTTIPLVMTIMSDPERFGITNLAKPGGHVTGLSTLTDVLYAKRLELLKEIHPNIHRIAVLRPLPNVSAIGTRVTSEAARSLGLELRTYDAGTPDTWATLFAAMRNDKCDALLQFIDGRFANRTTDLVILAAAHRLPAIYAEREFVDAGGLASYGISLADQWRRAASYVDKILKGAKPGDLPVQQPTRFELVINMRTARALGLAVPPALLSRADEVIE